MRALRVVGLDQDGETVICEDPENGDRFSVPADERLRAAARGDLTRLGQVQIEIEAQMRPREIQTRIRGGASVQQVASASGLPEQRVERYAYPVLLERAQVAEMSQRAHPIREDGPDVQTLGEVVAHTFGMRGHDYSETTWDSWRGDDNKWVVQLYWNAGRSENQAHWIFHPGAHGGTVAALDDHAADLLDPSPNRPLRTVRPVTELAREALELDQPESAESEPESHSEPAPASAAPRSAGTPSIPALDLDPGQPIAGPTKPDPSTPGPSTPDAPASDSPKSEPKPESAAAESTPEQAGEQNPVPDPETDDESPDKQEQDSKRGRKNHPIVPSWEDVLLGVRSHR